MRTSNELAGADADGGGRIGVAAASIVVGAGIDDAEGGNVGDPVFDGAVRASIVAEADGEDAGASAAAATAATGIATDADEMVAGAMP